MLYNITVYNKITVCNNITGYTKYIEMQKSYLTCKYNF